MNRLIRFGARSYTKLREAPGATSALALADQLMVGVTNFLTILMLGRLAGPDALGIFALIMTVFYLILAVQESLITIPYTIYCTRLKGLRHLQYSGAALCQTAVWAACVSAVLATMAAILYVVGGHPTLDGVLAAASFAAPMLLLREFARRYLFARMHLIRVMTMSIVSAVAQVGALCVFAYFGQLSDPTALIAVGIGAGVGALGWLWLGHEAFRFHRARWTCFVRWHWKFGRWLLASQGTSILAGNTMPWLVVVWLGPSATGVFAACDSILRFSNPIIVGMTNVLTPRVAIGLNDGGRAEMRRIVFNTTIVLGLFLVGFCLFLAVAGEWLLNRSFGSEYSAYWVTLVVLGVSQLISKMSLAPGRGLLALERTNILLRAEVAGFVVSLLAAMLLVPAYGILGAAVSLVLGSVAITTVTVGIYLAVIREPSMPLGPAAVITTSMEGFTK